MLKRSKPILIFVLCKYQRSPITDIPVNHKVNINLSDKWLEYIEHITWSVSSYVVTNVALENVKSQI